MRIKIYLQFLGILICSCLIAALLFKDNVKKIIYSKQKVFRLGLSQPVKNFDPASVFSDDGLTLISQSLDTLYQYHYLKRPYEIIPSMADGLPKITDEGKRYTIKIKEGIKYHEHEVFKGADRFVKAEDFVLQIKRLAFKPLNSTGSWLFRGKILGYEKFSEEVTTWQDLRSIQMEGLKVLDDLSFEIHLTRPEPNLLYYLAMTFTTPVPWELIEWTENDLSKVIVGTGPYKFDSQKSSVGNYFFKKYLDYKIEFYPSTGDQYANTNNLLSSSSNLLPFIPEIEFKVIENEDDIFYQFFDRKLDLTLVPNKYLRKMASEGEEFFKSLSKDKIEVKHFSKLTSRWVGFNMKDPVVGDNLNLRLAIAHALDRDRYLELISSNTNLKANSILNPGIAGYRPTTKLSYVFDLEKAKEYLDLAKIDLENMKPLVIATRGLEKLHLDEANFLKDGLERLGLKVEILPLSFVEFLRKGRSGELQIWIDNWIYDYPDAENILQLLITKNHPGINKSGYSNKEVDSLYEKLSVEEDQFKRFEYMYQIEKLVDRDIPWIMLMYESSYILQRENLKNFRRSYFIRNYLKYLKFE